MPSHTENLQPMSAQAAMDHEQTSTDHAQNVADFEMWNPQPHDSWVLPPDDLPLTMDELKARTRQVQVDHVRDMVPFWRKGVEAAEKGEVLRLEVFLDKLASEDRWGIAGIDDPWGPSIGPWPADHPWGAAVSGGEADPWGRVDDDPWGKVADWGGDEDSTLSMHAGRTVSDHNGNRRRDRNNGRGKGRNRNRGDDKAKHQDPYKFVEDIARQQDVDSERKRRMHDFFKMSTQDKVKKIEEMVRNLRTIRA